jgi:hypothetical protein
MGYKNQSRARRFVQNRNSKEVESHFQLVSAIQVLAVARPAKENRFGLFEKALPAKPAVVSPPRSCAV